MQGVIVDVITHTRFFVNRFRGFGVLAPENFAVSIGLTGRSYNSVSTAVLHCDMGLAVQLLFLHGWCFLSGMCCCVLFIVCNQYSIVI